MPIFAEYAVRETASNLWRNRLMTMAAILTVSVSLMLVGTTLLLKQGAANAEVEWQRGTQVVVWMSPTASTSEVAAISTQLKTLPYVHACLYRDKNYDYAEARKLLTPAEFSVLKKSNMPTSYRCTPNQPSDAQVVMNRFTGQPGVKEVDAPLQQIHSMEQAITFIQIVFIVVAVVLLLSATVLILNTIRLAIFARRREVSVMKLRMIAGLEKLSAGEIFIGVVLIAAAIVFVVHLWMDTSTNALLVQMRLSSWQIFWTDAVIVGLGAAIGAGGSAIAIRRFLDV